jgi:hypothetical protein
MSWTQKTIKWNNSTFDCFSHDEADLLTINAKNAIKVGDIIQSNDKTYEVITVTDFANRGEVLLVETKEQTSGKSSSRRTANKSSGSDDQGSSDA